MLSFNKQYLSGYVLFCDKGKVYFMKRNKNKDEVITIENLYAIDWTPSGPILEKVVDIKTVLKDDKSIDEYTKQTKAYYNFEVGKQLIVDWFMDRADTIDVMDEDQYFKKSATADSDFKKHMDDYNDQLNLFIGSN